MNTAHLWVWTSLWLRDFNEPNRAIFSHKSDNPTHQMWFKRRKKGQSTFKCESCSYPALQFLAASYLICRACITPLSSSSPFSRHIAQSLANVCQGKCDSRVQASVTYAQSIDEDRGQGEGTSQCISLYTLFSHCLLPSTLAFYHVWSCDRGDDCDGTDCNKLSCSSVWHWNGVSPFRTAFLKKNPGAHVRNETKIKGSVLICKCFWLEILILNWGNSLFLKLSVCWRPFVSNKSPVF